MCDKRPSAKPLREFAGSSMLEVVAENYFNRQLVFMLRFLTHAEYSKEKWKEEL
jgi:hypothetical protein